MTAASSESPTPAGEDLSPLQRALLDAGSCDRLFAVVSWGAAATMWLAKTLNAHPEMLCLHAGTDTIGKFGRGIEPLQYCRVLSVLGHGYRAVGDVHGIQRHEVPALRAALGDRFTAVIVVREPLARVHSLMRLFDRYRGHRAWDLRFLDALIEARQLTLPAADESRMFVHAANMLNAIDEESVIGHIYKAEELTSDAGRLAALVREISGGAVEPSPEWLTSCLQSRRINARALDEAWTPTEWQRDVLRAVVREDAWRAYERLGYRVPAFIS